MDQAEYKRLQKFIEPCLTPEELDEYIITNFGIELPWDIVDERSTSSSLKFLWEVNYSLLTNQGVNRHVLAAARNCAKTLTSSIIQFIAMVHYRRTGIHVAATLDQSSALIKYIDKFLRNPILAPYSQTNNVRAKILQGMPANDFTQVRDASLLVATATKKGTNSQRSSILTFDEVDLTPREILSEAAFIADPARVIRADGTIENYDPVFIYLSSRKSNNGPIQDLIDEAENPEQDDIDPVRLHKWSTVDWMEKCSKEQHKPEEGEISAYVNTDTLETIWGDDNFEAVQRSVQMQYQKYQGYTGCIKCPAWSACLGRSVKQRGLSPMLRTRKFIGSVLRAVKDAAQIIAQSLNWKPEATGLVFKNFTARHHIKDAISFYEWVTFGEVFNPNNLDDGEIERRIEGKCTYAEMQEITPTKDQIYDAMVENGWTIISGVDWGFVDPAVCVVLGFHKKFKRIAVLHVDHAFGYANHIWAQKCSEGTLTRFPVEFVAPDQEDPSSVTYFAKYKIRSLQRGSKPSRIITGISFLRGYLWDAAANQSRFAILDDGDTEKCNIFMIDEMRIYSHARDALGKVILDKFEDANDHSICSMRYALHPFTKEQSISASSIQTGVPKTSNEEILQDVAYGSKEEKKQALEFIKQKQTVRQQFIDHMLSEHGLDNIIVDKQPEPEQPDSKKKKPSGSIKFSI